MVSGLRAKRRKTSRA